MTDYGRRVVIRFGLDLLKHYGKSSPATAEIISWLESSNSWLGVHLPSDVEDAPRTRKGGIKLGSHAWKSLLQSMDWRLSELRNSRPGRFELNIREAGTSLGLNKKELLILELFCRIEQDEAGLDGLYRELVTDAGCDPFDIAAVFAGISRGEVIKLLGRKSRLVCMGLLTNDDIYKRYTVPNKFLLALLPPHRGLKDFRHAILGESVGAELPWESFEHLGVQRDLAFNLLKGALKTKAKGINILLYGPSGTGKTEFCKTLAARLGLTLHQVGETDENGSEPTRSERITSLKMAQHLAGKGALLLFDEMEDLQDSPGLLFFQSRRHSGSKVFGHRLLETNQVPVIWTSNDIHSFDPALLRRMTAAIELKRPPASVRKQIWKKVLDENRVTVSGEELEKLARNYLVAPGVAANAARVGRLAGGGVDQVQLTVKLMDRAMGNQASSTRCEQPRFYSGLASTDQNLQELTDDVCRSGRFDFSLLLSGPPGCGKSLYARDLAEKLGLEVLQKRASDLFSKWVGESEQQIAAAFEEAIQERAMLIFDEADSLLQNRQNATHSWEVTRVNEMLTWMESHPLPFVCTTNLCQTLDPASMRRFIFKVKFDYLSAAQIRLAFTTFFKFPAPTTLGGLGMLTPADFAIVKKKAEIQGCLGDPDRLVEMLGLEEMAKGSPRNALGF
ncbi:MAG: AAA family ATPase [bacterium]